MVRNTPTKKSYLELANVLILLSTFAGAVTLSTQFALPEACNASRVRALVAFASQFFLMCPIAASSIYVALHNRPDGQVVETGTHAFIQIQFGLIGVMIIAGFLLLNIALHFAGGRYLGSAGLGLSAVFILATAAYSIEDHLSQPKPEVESRTNGDTPARPQVSMSQYLGMGRTVDQTPLRRISVFFRWWIVVLVAMEVVGFMFLLGLGITETVLADSTACQLL
ncbi:unnamed protein product [Clonostachys rosea f. rosea IK726]|jgi:hypothetical protein|uniref:Uncharacterized protein n=1 Tax=Clonostachys rosea f. rosea IK726 TaxID=1349383 RepID=A0ACA9UHF0_BIOOC|nr:unnamed protein product [Clonostachys rosea f. rosea IK726]